MSAFDWFLDAVLGGAFGLLARLTGVEALGYPYLQRAILAGVCVAVVAPLVGSFLVHREMAFIGETLAHTAFAGVAIGLLLESALDLSVSPYLTALVVAVLAALLIELVVERTGAAGDVSMALVLAGGFALGTVLITYGDGGIAVGVGQYLFGSLATVTRADAAVLLGLTLLVVAVVVVTYRQLLAVTLDETAARVAGVRVTRYTRLLVVLTAAVVVAAMQIMGVILVAAMLVAPVAAATHLARSFRGAVLAAVVVAQIGALLGIAAAYALDVAAGGAIVLVLLGIYVLAVVTSRPVPG